MAVALGRLGDLTFFDCGGVLLLLEKGHNPAQRPRAIGRLESERTPGDEITTGQREVCGALSS